MKRTGSRKYNTVMGMRKANKGRSIRSVLAIERDLDVLLSIQNHYVFFIDIV